MDIERPRKILGDKNITPEVLLISIGKFIRPAKIIGKQYKDRLFDISPIKHLIL